MTTVGLPFGNESIAPPEKPAAVDPFAVEADIPLDAVIAEGTAITNDIDAMVRAAEAGNFESVQDKLEGITDEQVGNHV